MSVRIRKRRGAPWLQMPRAVVEDRELSWKAKGLYAYLVSRPDDWEIRRRDLIRRATDGSTSLDSGVEELQEAGLLEIVRTQDSEGKFSGSEWIVDWPEENRVPENGDTDNANPSREVSKPYREDSKTSSSAPAEPTLDLGLEGSENGSSPKASREDFEKLWAAARRGSKKKAWEQYRKAVPKKVDAGTLGKAWLALVASTEDENFIPHFFRWIRDERWEEEIPDSPDEEPEVGSEEWAEREYNRIMSL